MHIEHLSTTVKVAESFFETGHHIFDFHMMMAIFTSVAGVVYVFIRVHKIYRKYVGIILSSGECAQICNSTTKPPFSTCLFQFST